MPNSPSTTQLCLWAYSTTLRQVSTFFSKALKRDYRERFIPCHTYNVKTGMTSGLFGWGRGLGWYAIGLIDAWRELPNAHPQKAVLAESVTKFARAAIKFQQPYGGWAWLVTNAHTTPDSSATATIAWFLANAASIDEINVDCSESDKKALQHLMKVTKRDGAVDLSQGDTKDVGVYSTEFGILPFAQGFALRAAYFNASI